MENKNKSKSSQRKLPIFGDGQPDPYEPIDADALRQGYITDFISGKPVRASAEELEAVQVFSKRLVNEFGYPKSHIVTRPQFKVRAQPSGSASKGYPLDIAVFSSERQVEEDLSIIVECKRKTRTDGEKQLKIYMSLSPATIGVWYNGKNHLYLHKRYLPDGTIAWEYLPSIPRFGQSIEDIGSIRRSELTPPSNLKATFNDIRNHLAGNAVGITRDQALAQEIMSVLFCKIYDEINTPPDEIPEFRARVGEPPERVAERIGSIFESVKKEYSDVFAPEDHIALDAESLQYVVGELQNVLVTGASRDVIGDAFEVFIGPAVRGEEGQFFTPRNAVQLIVRLMDPKPGEMVIDPACGSGGFLVVALEHIWGHIEREAEQKGWNAVQLDKRRREIAQRCVRGLDKDSFLTRLTKAYMAIIGDGRGGIYCENSLDLPSSWHDQTRASIKPESFDVVITNPPFGSKIKITGSHRLHQYKLAREWKLAKGSSEWVAGSSFRKEQSPQILFIERCVQLLKPGGRLGILLPESIFGMPKYGYVVQWLLENFTLHAFVSLPDEVFQPYTHAKTCVLVLENSPPPADYKIEMAIADWCGHDSRGNPTLRVQEDGSQQILDDLPLIADRLESKFHWSSHK